MIHEMNVEAVLFNRVSMGEITAVIVDHGADFQTGDGLSLFEQDQWGSRKTHHVDRDRNGRFASYYEEGTPVRTEITHVMLASRCDGLVAGKVLLSFTLLEAP